MAKLSMGGSLYIGKMHGAEGERSKGFKNRGKAGNGAQLTMTKPSTPGASGVGKDWYVGAQKKS